MARKNNIISEIDKIIGQEIATLRLSNGMSRQCLANSAGVTHQQLQKYEKGVNRLSVGRLFLIAEALGTNVEYFYQNLDQISQNSPRLNDSKPQRERLCLEASRNFMQVAAQHQEAVNKLMKALSTKKKMIN